MSAVAELDEASFDELTTLSEGEAQRLVELEAQIGRSIRSFVDLGRALREVRDSRLYREAYSTFEDYCRDKWDIGRVYAHRIIEAVAVVEVLPNGNTPRPRTESQARELAPLIEEPSKLIEVWEVACSAAVAQGRPVTADHVREARKSVAPSPPPAPTPPSAASAPSRPKASPEHDSRFEQIIDAVALLELLPAPSEIVFPVEEGDVEALDEAILWLADWAPQVKRAWRGHRASLRRSA